jgi:hypothetical protein
MRAQTSGILLAALLFAAGGGAASCFHCGGPPPPPSADAGGPAWSAECSGLSDAVLGAWALSPTDLWFVGGNSADGRSSALHYDGAAWTMWAGLGTALLRDAWSSSRDDVWLAGDDTTLLHWDGAVWQRACVAGGSGDVAAVWGSAPDAAWAVGRSTDPAVPGALLLYWEGATWIDGLVDGAALPALNGLWGAAADDVWAVGEDGAVARFDGSVWRAQPSPTAAPLHAVHGLAADDVWAVGGDSVSGGVVLHFDGTAWTVADAAPPAAILRAVWAEPTGTTVVVGDGGFAARYAAPGAAPIVLDTGTARDLACVCSDGAGLWAAGGDPVAVVPPRGAVVHFGAPPGVPCAPVPAVAEVWDCDPWPPCGAPPGSVPPGGECTTGTDCECQEGYECWFVTCGPMWAPCASQSANHFVCTRSCADDLDCLADFGLGSCCVVPGPEVVTEICHPADWPNADGDVCM